MKKTNAIKSHLYVESEKAKFTETESRIVAVRGLGVEGIGEMMFKGYNPSSYKMNKWWG